MINNYLLEPEDPLINIARIWKPLLFMHIPKTGGTSIESNAMQYNIVWGYPLFMQFNFFMNTSKQLCDMMDICTPFPWHIPLSKWVTYFSLPNITNNNNMSLYYDLNRVEYFCVVRHPFTKLISEYKYLIQFKSQKQLIPNCNNTDNNYCNEKSLNIWIQNALSNYQNKINSNKRYYCYNGCHFVQQYDFVYDSFGNQLCKHIIHYEYLNEQIEKLFKQYNLKTMHNNLLKFHHTIGARCGHANFSVHNLTNQTKTVIYNTYEQDFKAFGYQFA